MQVSTRGQIMGDERSNLESGEFEVPEFHRDEEQDDAGVSQVVIEQFVEDRLPALLEIKAQVDAGKALTDNELEVMTRIVEDSEGFNRFVYEFPEYKVLVAKLIDLYEEISDKALENEQRQNG
jgi:hypothetical protein